MKLHKSHSKTVKHNPFKLGVIAISCSAVLVLGACGGGGGGSPAVQTPAPAPTPTPAPTPAPTPTTPTESNQLIKINQVGFLTADIKIAVIPETTVQSFEVIDAANNTSVMTGELTEAATWSVAQDSVRLADFSSVTVPGQYIIRVDGIADSTLVNIGADTYLAAHDATLKAYYFNRASMELEEQYAGVWSRPLGHPDTNITVHSSAASAGRPEGTIISAPKGWYDAGDYNKYIVNSGISTYTLMAAYEHFPDFYTSRDINIPESGDAIPDILDEVKWNLDWMMAMQDPNDGGVYHKLTTQGFSGTVMPHQATAQRFVVSKGTGATLNFAATLAVASRVYGQLPAFAAQAQQYAAAAVDAWEWAVANPDIQFGNPSGFSTGEYGDSNFAGEFSWAAAELFLLTNEQAYLDAYKSYDVSPGVPGWQDTAGLPYVSIMHNGESVMSAEDFALARTRLIELADNIVDQHRNSAYLVAMEQGDYFWGSNSGALNKAMMLMQAYTATDDKKYREAATSLVDYVLGRNPTDYSFLTGHGAKTPLDIHHRPSFSDNVDLPVPGFVAGGPHSGQQDNCSGYPSSLPALSYLDDWCSYSTNEITINWNAPMVYVLAALHNTQD